jgi:hypothetical protein
MTMEFCKRFLSLALEKRVITKEPGRVYLDPYFGGSDELLNLATAACVEAIEQNETMLKADVLVAFDGLDYPLAKSLEKSLSLPAVHFMKHHTISYKGKKVMIVGTLETEVELYGAKNVLRKQGAEVLGAVMMFSEVFMQQKNKNLDLLVERVVTGQQVLREYGLTIV